MEGVSTPWLETPFDQRMECNQCVKLLAWSTHSPQWRYSARTKGTACAPPLPITDPDRGKQSSPSNLCYISHHPGQAAALWSDWSSLMLLSALISSQGHGGPSKADPRPAVQELKSARHGGQIWVGVVSKNRYRISFSGCKFFMPLCVWKWNRPWISNFWVFTSHRFRYDRVKCNSIYLIYVLIWLHLWQNPH